ncbi:MAG: NifB/NifX family molybdenum-iron cluster-binding protein [Tepidanaerobacteraceae bacterium]|nr:NifB/NifX family molybdenum-iron cluster-binding protein [Tepidanaerobacteraceae bacterium]
MKIAIATEGNVVSAHFGHCPQYTIFDVDEKQNKINSKKIIENPGHQPGFLPGYLAELGVNCIIAGGMGPRAQELFAQNKIETITGVSGRVDDVIQEYLEGNIAGSGNLCDHEEGDHGGHCSH